MQNPCHGNAAPDESDADAEIRRAGNESPRPVERVDEQELIAALNAMAPGVLLRDHRQRREGPRHFLEDQRLRGPIRFRDRRLIPLQHRPGPQGMKTGEDTPRLAGNLGKRGRECIGRVQGGSFLVPTLPARLACPLAKARAPCITRKDWN